MKRDSENSTSTRANNLPPDCPKEWVLPAAIPFLDLKRRDLEECLYWLLDSMGAKDLEWRTGGSGAGAADGGRDLEARFYTPTADGDIEAQTWWIECKGRTGTVESDVVKSAVNNALAIYGLDYLVIATNTQFSNPTLEWLKQWQMVHPSPKVKLWDRVQLERYLSRHPDVVLRLFSEALSLDGRFKAMEMRFWNKIDFVAPKTLADLWDARESLNATEMGMFAAIANEFAHGSIIRRPWAAALSPDSLSEVVAIGFQNIAYLAVRCNSAGVEQHVLFRALAYLVLVAIDVFSVELVTELIMLSVTRGDAEAMPEEAVEMMLGPVADQLQAELQDVCSSDCRRMLLIDKNILPNENDGIETYWMRLNPDGLRKSPDHRRIRLEKLDAPCSVGFTVDKTHGCPLFDSEVTGKNLAEFLAVVKRVAEFRKKQAADKQLESESRRKTNSAGTSE